MTNNADRVAGYYWVTLDDMDEPVPAAWVGGNWYLPGDYRPAQEAYLVQEVARIEPPKAAD